MYNHGVCSQCRMSDMLKIKREGVEVETDELQSFVATEVEEKKLIKNGKEEIERKETKCRIVVRICANCGCLTASKEEIE